jgi:hypothetical protein
MRGLGHAGPVTCMTEMTSAVGANAKGGWIVTGGVDHNLMVRRCAFPVNQGFRGAGMFRWTLRIFLREALGRSRLLL